MNMLVDEKLCYSSICTICTGSLARKRGLIFMEQESVLTAQNRETWGQGKCLHLWPVELVLSLSLSFSLSLSLSVCLITLCELFQYFQIINERKLRGEWGFSALPMPGSQGPL